jgi:RNA polymerase sigma-70 factor (family 1)
LRCKNKPLANVRFFINFNSDTITTCLLSHSQHNEKELLLRTSTGDPTAFSILFYRYHQELAVYILRLTRSLSLTEEIVQETFLKLWIKREQLAEVHDFRSWLFTVSRNHTFNCMRDLAKKAVQQRVWISEALRHQVPADEAPDREYYYSLIEEAVDHLSPQQQKIYLLSRRDGLKYEEIADQLQLSRNTVKRHMSLALHTIVSYVRARAPRALPFILLFLSQL